MSKALNSIGRKEALIAARAKDVLPSESMSEVQRKYSEIKLARGVLFHRDHILLVQNQTGKGHYFLPGGKVDPGESVITALIREFQEELAWAIQPKKFIGCYENAWKHVKKSGTIVDVLEINFLWTFQRVDEKPTLENPPSMEDKIRFEWVRLDQLESLPLLPTELKEILPRLHHELEQGKIQTFWGTSLKTAIAKH